MMAFPFAGSLFFTPPLLVSDLPNASPFSVGILTVLLLVAALFAGTKKRRLTHAGGLVYKTENGRKKYLIITAARDEDRWVLPKGRIEKKETAEFAAIREVVEEAGVLAAPQKTLGHQRYVKSGEKVNIKYFLMKYVQDVAPSKEQRKQLWLSKEEAVKKITFDDTKKLLQRV